jgi:hypothetical protein
MTDDPVPGIERVDEFLTAAIVRSELCLNYDVTFRILQGSAGETCAGSACPQRRLCLSRTLRRYLGAVSADTNLRDVYDAALQELGNGR